MRNRRRSRVVIALGLGTAMLALLAGCGMTFTRPVAAGGSCLAVQPAENANPNPVLLNIQPDPAAIAQLPEAVKTRGTLTFAEDPSYAPNEFTAGGSSQPIGMDIDLANAIGKTLGLKVVFTNSSFDGIIAGIQAGRYDVGMSSLTDTKEREQTVDFVTYFKAGTSTMVLKCNPKGIHSDLDLCGKNVGAENGTIQIDELSKPDVDGSIVAKCTKAGKAPPNAKGYPAQTDANSALQAGRIDAYIADSPVVDYALKQTGGAFEKAGSDEGVAPYGIAIPKNAGTLKNALQTAINKLMANGGYQKILDNWGVSDGALDQAKINDAQG